MRASTTPGALRAGFRRRAARGGGVPAGEAVALALLLASGVAGLFAFLWIGSYSVAGARGYLQSEIAFTNAHQGALRHLHRFAATRDEEAWRNYEQALAVPWARMRARRHLVGSEPSLREARAALLETGVHRSDLDAMLLFVRFRRWIPEVEQGLAIWANAHAIVRRIHTRAAEIHRATRSGGAEESDVRALLDQLALRSAELRELDRAFSEIMTAGSRRRGRWLLGLSSGGAVLVFGLGLAVSTRLVRRIRSREAHFQSIIENTSDVVTLLDIEGRIVYQSPAVERLLGYAPEQLVGSSVFERVHPDDLARAEEVIRDLVDDPAALRNAEFRFRHAGGSWRTIATTSSSYRDEAQERRILVNARDITVQRELENRLAQAGRLESVGRLAGGISHDFNNLLTAILGAADAARASLPEDARASGEIDEIVVAAGRAAELTRQLLAFARRQIVDPVVFDIAEVVGEMEGFLRRLLDERIELSIALPERPVHIRADRTQFEQVVVNLAVNARDAMPEGGRLEISVARRQLDAATAAREEGHPGPYALLEVKDSGIAMEPAVLERIFEPFFSTKEASRGSGLGLATTYGIVRQSGGFITVTSERGHGSRFCVYLPECGAPKTAVARPPAPSRGTGHERLLLVEDQPEVRKVAARALRARGYEVIETGDGEEALHWAREHPDEFDLLITDVVMPRLGGPALAERLRKHHPDLPVVFTSGYSDDERILGAADAGTVLVQKPFTPNGLAERVRALLDEERDAR